MRARSLAALLSAAALVVTGGCSRDLDILEPAPFPSQATVFDDAFGESVTFQAFAGSKLDAVQIDLAERYQGDASLKITVPVPGDPTGSFAGGAFTASIARDLSGYNALTFWGKSATPATLNVAGIGNDNTGTSLYMAETGDLQFTTSWKKYVIPLPLPDKLGQEKGLFYFAEGAENGQANTFWFDEIQFETLTGLGAPRPAVTSKTVSLDVGSTTQAQGTVTFGVGGQDVLLSIFPSYFTWTSSAPAVATVSTSGLVTMVADGSATITATLGSVQATGSVTVTSESGPQTAAPTPTQDAAKVISLFSDAYTDVAVGTWSADWDQADVADVQIAGNAAKKYSSLVFAGIEFATPTVDATSMTHFHMDLWTPDPTASPAVFKIKLVDFGADGAFGGGDDAEHEITLTAATTPALATGSWVSVDIPFSQFTGLTTRGHLAQLIISGDPNTVYVDNVYFYQGDTPPPPATEPATAAPTPTQEAAKVISMFSDAYTDVAVDTWHTDWSVATYEEVQVAGNAAKKYSVLDFNGIEATTTPIDATSMTHFRMDIWTPNATQFGIKLVDFGADGAFGGGDDTEHQVNFNAATTPALATGEWMSLDIPLADFGGLGARAHLAQFIIVGQPTGTTTVWVDNVYFYEGDAPPPAAEPTTAAPTPTLDAADVISLFSDAYTDVTVDTWSASWDQAAVSDVQIDGNPTKKYTGLTFAGIEFTSSTVDATAMTHFHMDIWTPDPTADPAAFKIKLVDFGADGVWSNGGDDVEHEITLTASTTPALATGQWLSLDIPLSDFTNLTTRGHLAQLIISGNPNTVFVDNVFFHK